MDGSSNCLISRNNITWAGYWGIGIVDSSNNTLSGNVIHAHSNLKIAGSQLGHFMHSIDASNLIDGKPVYYLVNQKDLTISPVTHPQIGFLALINCTNITVEGQNLTNNVDGLLLAYTNNSEVVSNTIRGNTIGINLYFSSNNTLQGNEVKENIEPWQDYDWSADIYLVSSSDNIISENNVTHSPNGIILYSSNCNTILSNNIEYHAWGTQIYLDSSNNNLIIGNNIIGYGDSMWPGIWLSLSNDTIICDNNITNNLPGISLRSSEGNSIYHNNFENREQASSQNSASSWDDCYPSGGNYWSDYLTRYPAAQELDDSGI